MTTFEDIQKAKQLIAAGKRADARQLLSSLVQADPSSAEGWYLLSYAVDATDKVIYCLDRAAKLAPLNRAIRERMSKFKLQTQQEQNSVIAPRENRLAAVSQTQTPQPETIVHQPSQQTSISSIITFIFIILAILSFLGISLPSKLNVKYVVRGSAQSAFVTYINNQDGMEQVEVYLPFEKSYTFSSSYALSIVAVNNGSGSITCEIWVNGSLKKTSTTTADYGVVTCVE